MSIQTNKAKSNRELTEGKSASEQLSYPVDLSQFLSLSQVTLDAMGIPYNENPTGYHPTIIAQYALINWNQYLGSNEEGHREAFLKQAFWLVEHEVNISDDAGGWPISFPHPDVSTRGPSLQSDDAELPCIGPEPKARSTSSVGPMSKERGRGEASFLTEYRAPWLSSLTQGIAISVLLRAYRLTQQEVFFEVARRAVCTFERDILDGGISTPVGSEGIFFEEVAVYPAAHTLVGFIFAILGLYDYLALTGDTQIRGIIHRSHATLHELLDEFDAGFWTYTDLLQRRLASPSHLALQVALLEALAGYSDCAPCTSLASNWKGRQRRFSSRLRYLISSHRARYGHALWKRIRTIFFPRFDAGDFLRVCVPITAFPVLGGMRAVLAGVAQVTEDIWRIEYLTQRIGPHPDGFVIHRFGIARMFPPQFPNVWLYCITGFCKLFSLMRKSAGYHVIMPQDGVFTAAFAALAGKLAGVRVVCIDHGNLTLINNRAFRIERIQGLEINNWPQPRRLLARLRYGWYWPSQRLLAKFATRLVDHFLIPGIEGDGVEECCRQLGVPRSRITRFASVIDMDRHRVPDSESRSRIREEKGIAANAIVISLVSRLTPEKGIEIALEGISQALSVLPRAVCERVRIIIAGEGPLRKHIEEEIRESGLSQNCALWGEVSSSDAIALLGISDIFLYTSTRGACFSMSVLEAMASSCAVIASTEPMSNAYLLAEGRGIAVPPGDAEQTGAALARLINDPEGCCQMGLLARDYIARNHNPAIFRRSLIRLTHWSALETLLKDGRKVKDDLDTSHSSRNIEFSYDANDQGGLEMNGLTRRQKLWRTFPIIGVLVWEWEVWRKDRIQLCYRLWPEPRGDSHLLPYPIDMWPLMELPGQTLDEAGVLYTLQTDVYPGAYHPTDIAQYALVNWNAYLKTKDEKYRQTFMTQARWLVIHETLITENAGGWPIPFPNQEFHATKPWLSALTQGVGISVLVRAYQITGEDDFIQTARRAVHTFELDILDGGVSCTVGDDGVFFEEVAVYPAAHILNGYLLSLFGLYDYVALTNDARIQALIQRSLATLHMLIDGFDLGYGSRYDLLSKLPTNRFYHALHVTLLEALAQYSGCQHCAMLAARWAHYQHGFKPFINHLVRRTDRYRRAFRRLLYQMFRGNAACEETHQGKIAHSARRRTGV